jgi:hypothetical protein
MTPLADAALSAAHDVLVTPLADGRAGSQLRRRRGATKSVLLLPSTARWGAAVGRSRRGLHQFVTW